MPAVSMMSFKPSGMPCSGPRQRPRMDFFSALRRGCSSANFGGHGDEGIERRIELLDLRQAGFRPTLRVTLPSAYPFGGLRDGCQHNFLPNVILNSTSICAQRRTCVVRKVYNLSLIPGEVQESRHGPDDRDSSSRTQGFSSMANGSKKVTRSRSMLPTTVAVVGRVYQGTREHVEAAIAAAVKAFGTTRRLPAFERQRVLRRVAEAYHASQGRVCPHHRAGSGQANQDGPYRG